MLSNIYDRIRKIVIFILTAILILHCSLPTYAKSYKTENDRIEVLYLLNIIDDKENLDDFVSREQFAKIIVKASSNKDRVDAYTTTDVCTDVKSDNIYSKYIKVAIDNKYMFTYLGGYFKPKDYITYSDCCRACLTLLSYTNDDFTGNRVNAYNNKFAELKLNDNIEKAYTDFLTKRDIINAIYNTLKEDIKDTVECYGLKVFDKLKFDSDTELNAYDAIEKKIEGPYIIKTVDEVPDGSKYNSIYLNGRLSSIDDFKYDISNYNFAVYYKDDDNKTLYTYTERTDVSAPLMLKKGYVNDIEYNASNMTMPYRVNISDYFYYLDSEEAKFMFSYAGSVTVGDYIYFLSNKLNDTTKSYLDSDGTYHANNDDAVIYSGSIVTVFKQ